MDLDAETGSDVMSLSASSNAEDADKALKGSGTDWVSEVTSTGEGQTIMVTFTTLVAITDIKMDVKGVSIVAINQTGKLTGGYFTVRMTSDHGINI